MEGRHTIWELVDHCSYWMEAVTGALRGEAMPTIESTEDWPRMGETEGEWTRARERLTKAHEALVGSIEEFDKSLLERVIESSWGGRRYTYTCREMLHGVSDHNVYHAGQIAILREGAP